MSCGLPRGIKTRRPLTFLGWRLRSLLWLFLPYHSHKEIKPTTPPAVGEDTAGTHCNTSPPEDLECRCWTLLQNPGNRLSCIGNGIFISMNCWCSYTNSRAALGEPVNMLLSFHAVPLYRIDSTYPCLEDSATGNCRKTT